MTVSFLQQTKPAAEVYVPLEEALHILSKRHGVFFTYLKDVIQPYEVEISSTLQFDLEESLQLLLRGTPLQFKKVSRLNYLIFNYLLEEGFGPNLSSAVSDRAAPKVLAAHRITRIRSLKPLPMRRIAPQKFILEGRILNERNEALPGVNISVKGRSFEGAVTDLDGYYRLALQNGDQTLVCSYVGYHPKEVPVHRRRRLDVTMQENVALLSEVVVVGYGGQNRRDVIGSISKINAAELQNVQAASADQQLQAWAAGVQVQSSSGLPGAPVRVLVRGANSLFSGTEPLWIIDGMILSSQGGAELNGFSRNNNALPLNPLATLNPNDIASIQVLKDAAATAIYGSRGANGVIIITTKSGKEQGGSLDLRVSLGATDVVRSPEDIGYVDGPTWLRLADEARLNSGLSPFDPGSLLDNNRDSLAVLDRSQLANTNWFDQILRRGAVREVNLSGSQNSDKWRLYWSGNYRDEAGVLINDHLSRLALRTNLDFEVRPNVSVASRISLSYTDRQRAPNGGPPGGNTNMATSGYDMANTGSLPIFPVYHPTARDAAGNPRLFDPLSGRNLAATFNRDNYINDVQTYRALAGLQFKWQLPFVPGLSLHSEWATDLIQTSNIEWGNTVIREHSNYAFDFSSTFQRLNYNLYASLERSLGEAHHFNWVVGAESTRQFNRVRNVEAQQLTGGAKEVGTPGNIMRVSTGRGGERYFRGYFSRFNYKLADRYLAGLSFRRDGSSIFEEDHRWGDFLAFSAGWVLSEEPFMPDIKALDFLKLKGSFGQTGNSAINSLATETTYTGWGRYGDVGAGDLLTGIGNSSITWETTEALDAGLELELFNGRISGSLGYYWQHTRDMLYRVPVPVSSGVFASVPTIWHNIGDLSNQGWELELNSVNVARPDFTWRMTLNFSTNKNQITRLTGEADEIYDSRQNPLVSKVGQRIGYYRLARYAGIDREGGYELIQEMDLEHFAATGERRPTGNVIPATRRNLSLHLFDLTDKSGMPTWFGGLSHTLIYKNWELFALFSFSGGNYIYDQAERDGSYVNGPVQIRQKVVGNYWTPDNTGAELPALRWDNRYDILLADGSILPGERFDRISTGHAHDKYLYPGDYLRLRSLSLHYTLPESLTRRLRMEKVRLGLNANNLFTLTDYPGIDPEFVNLNGNRNLGQGWNGIQLPQAKSLFFNLDISF